MRQKKQRISLGRHRRNCSICAHENRAEIESDFARWHSPAAIAKQYGIADRASIYRHAHALGLFEERRKNVRAALESIIEKAGEVDVTSSAVVAAVQAYSKINAAGEWIEPKDQINMRELFDRMSPQELQQYAQTGALPEWLTAFTLSYEQKLRQ